MAHELRFRTQNVLNATEDIHIPKIPVMGSGTFFVEVFHTYAVQRPAELSVVKLQRVVVAAGDIEVWYLSAGIYEVLGCNTGIIGCLLYTSRCV